EVALGGLVATRDRAEDGDIVDSIESCDPAHELSLTSKCSERRLVRRRPGLDVTVERHDDDLGPTVRPHNDDSRIRIPSVCTQDFAQSATSVGDREDLCALHDFRINGCT